MSRGRTEFVWSCGFEFYLSSYGYSCSGFEGILVVMVLGLMVVIFLEFFVGSFWVFFSRIENF